VANLCDFLTNGCEPICRRDDCTRDLGHGGHRNLSGAISWLTFTALKRWCRMLSGRDCTKPPAEWTVCFQRNPSCT